MAHGEEGGLRQRHCRSYGSWVSKEKWAAQIVAAALFVALLVTPAQSSEAPRAFVPFPDSSQPLFVVSFGWRAKSQYSDYKTASLLPDNNPEVAWSKYQVALDGNDLEAVINSCVKAGREYQRKNLSIDNLKEISQARTGNGVKILIKGIASTGNNVFIGYGIYSPKEVLMVAADKISMDETGAWGVDPREAINSIQSTLLGASSSWLEGRSDYGKVPPASDYLLFSVSDDSLVKRIDTISGVGEALILFVKKDLFIKEKIRLSKPSQGNGDAVDFLRAAYRLTCEKGAASAQSYFYKFDSEKDCIVSDFNWSSNVERFRENVVYFVHDFGKISYFVLGDERKPKTEGFIVDMKDGRKICNCNRFPSEALDYKNVILSILLQGKIIKSCLEAKEAAVR